ncbi:MAG: hypothetical protein ACREVE_10210 [Gammaproteobacteria bacterium]
MIALTALSLPAFAQTSTEVATQAKSADKPVSTVSFLTGTRQTPRLPTFTTRSSPQAADNSADSTHQDVGSALRWQEQNPAYGAVKLEARRDPASRFPADDGQQADHFSMNQQGLVFNDAWRMDNSVGEQRTRTQPMVGSGYRYALPETPLLGVATRSYAKDTEFNWTAGQAGVVQGKKIKSFEATTDQVSGFGGRQNLSADWRMGGQAWQVRGDAGDEARDSLASALEYHSSDGNHRHTAHVAQDNEDNRGSWLDSDHKLGAWRQRYGVYHFEPRLRWVNKKMADDREGLYWRTDHERRRTAWFTGAEVERTNIDAKPKVAGLLKTFGFVGVEQRLDAATSIGGSFRYGFEHPGVGKPTPEARIRKLKTFLERQFPIGVSRFGTRVVERDSLKKPKQKLGVFWDHAWLKTDSDRFKTSLGLTHLTRGEETFLVPSTGLNLNYAFTRRFELEGSMHYLWQETGDRQEDAASYVITGANWLAGRDWRVSLNGRWDGEVLKADHAHRDLLNRVYLGIAYQPGGG